MLTTMLVGMMLKLMKRKKLKDKSMQLLTQMVRKISDCSLILFIIWLCLLFCLVFGYFLHPLVLSCV